MELQMRDTALSRAFKQAGGLDARGRMEALFDRLVTDGTYELEAVKAAVLAEIEGDAALFDEIIEPWYVKQRLRRLVSEARGRADVPHEVGDGKHAPADGKTRLAIPDGEGAGAMSAASKDNRTVAPAPKPSKRNAAVMSDAGRATADYPYLDHYMLGGKPLGDLTREECLSYARILKGRSYALNNIASKVPPGGRVRDHVKDDEVKKAFRNGQRNANVNG
jgi:hypothetical protein